MYLLPKTCPTTRPPYILCRNGDLQKGDIYQDDRGWRWRVLCRIADRPRVAFPDGMTKDFAKYRYIMQRVTGPNVGEKRVIELAMFWVSKASGGVRYLAACARPEPDMHRHTIDVFQREWRKEIA